MSVESNQLRIAGVRVLPNGPHYDLHGFCIEGYAKRMVSVGASPECDIVLDDPMVSGLHCLLERHGARVRVHDCLSKNGTWVNGVRAADGDLSPGAVLTLGHTHLVAYESLQDFARVNLTASNLGEFLLGAVDYHGSLRSAAEAIGLPYSTLRGWLQRRLRRTPSESR